MEDHLVQMFRNRAAVFGNKLVFRYHDLDTNSLQNYTWHQGLRIVNALARGLLSFSHGPGSMIGIFSDNRPEWTLADLAILSVGGVVVPFFSTASKQQVKYIVDETAMELMFVGNNEQLEKGLWLLENCESLDTIVLMPSVTKHIISEYVLRWDQLTKAGDKAVFDMRLEEAVEAINEDQVATILYTSGTTGEPKGVMLTHENFMSCMQIHDKRLNVGPDDVSLCFLPLSHVFERSWTYYMIHKGAINVYLENPREVISELSYVKPTLMCAVPRFFEKTYNGILAEEAKWPSSKRKLFNRAIKIGYKVSEYKSRNASLPLLLKLSWKLADKLVLKKLRMVFGGNIRSMPCSGAAIRPELLRFFHAAGIFVNYGYGASETTATVSCFRHDHYEFGSCGTIMPDVNVKISEQGEILVKGATIFKGYYKKPELTSSILRDGWYHTGDKGNFTLQGNLVMEDRINDLFKTSGGKYVSPQKIELLIGQDPFVEQVVVIGDNRKFISAIIVPSMAALAKHFDAAVLAGHDEIIEDESVVKFFQERLSDLQQELTPFERVVKFVLLKELFSVENDALTSTLKVKRKAVARSYSHLIEAIYKE